MQRARRRRPTGIRRRPLRRPRGQWPEGPLRRAAPSAAPTWRRTSRRASARSSRTAGRAPCTSPGRLGVGVDVLNELAPLVVGAGHHVRDGVLRPERPVRALLRRIGSGVCPKTAAKKPADCAMSASCPPLSGSPEPPSWIGPESPGPTMRASLAPFASATVGITTAEKRKNAHHEDEPFHRRTSRSSTPVLQPGAPVGST